MISDKKSSAAAFHLFYLGLGLLLVLLRWNSIPTSVIFGSSPNDLLPVTSATSAANQLFNEGFSASSPWTQLFPSRFSGKSWQREMYMRDVIESFRLQPPVVQFNAELAVLTTKPPVRAGVPLPPSSNVTAQGSFDATAEALGDLFMTETYLQSNLDVDEITAVAGFVSKEDMDVQRLVDVLWRQDEDLGAGRDCYEYSICPPKDIHQKNAETKLEPYLVPTLYPPRPQRDTFEQYLVDHETGELIQKAATGNDTRDPDSGQTSNATYSSPPANFGPRPVDGNDSISSMRLEEQQLQSLIEALDSLNSSTLQAAVNEGQLPHAKAVEERWQDVESVIADPPAQSSLQLQNIPVPQFYNNVVPSNTNNNFGGSFVQNIAPIHQTCPVTAPPRENADQLNTFDLFSMFMDPPTNWSLPALNSPMKANGSDYNPYATQSFNNSNSFNGQNVGVVPNGPMDLFGRGEGNRMVVPDLHPVVHEGPFDFSAFSYSQPPLQPISYQQQQQQSPPQQLVPMDSRNAFVDQTNMFDWNMTGIDWSGIGGIDLNDSSLQTPNNNSSSSSSGSSGPIEYYSSPGATVPVNTSSVEWKILQDFPPPINTTDFPALVEDSKVKVQEKKVAERKPVTSVESFIKQEEVDPWTEHVNYAAHHNHTYSIRDRDGSMESHDGSEDDHHSFTGSTGSGSNSNRGSSRYSRDNRAASELRLPMTAEEIVNMPVEEFNNYITGQIAQLHNDQIQLMKDIRRRGKNKVAAQNCRRRKIDNMSHLEREIMGLREELKAATIRRDQLSREREMYRSMLRGPIIQGSSSVNIVDSGMSAGSSHHSVIKSLSSHSFDPSALNKAPKRQDSSASSDDKPLRKRKRDE